MTFGQQYLTYLDCIQNLGMSRIDEIEYEAPTVNEHKALNNINLTLNDGEFVTIVGSNGAGKFK